MRKSLSDQLRERMNSVISLTRRVFELSTVAIRTGIHKAKGEVSRHGHKNLKLNQT